MQTMALKEKVMLMVLLLLLLCVVSTSPKSGVTAELEDTIHALREENSYLQERLESLTIALRQLRKLLWDHSKESTVDLDSNEPHFWDDWSEFGKRTDAYQLLEQAFCGKELRGAARCSPRAHGVLLLFSLCLAHLL